MSDPYEEILAGEFTLRLPPGPRHELICARLHGAIKASVANFRGMKLLDPRTQIRVNQFTAVRPDLALLTTITGKLWFAVEVVSSEDHHTDTVIKKQIYEDLKVPRLWMVDPRYDNIEVYQATEYGLKLNSILAGRDVLSEKLLPEFQLVLAELFASPTTHD